MTRTLLLLVLLVGSVKSQEYLRALLEVRPQHALEAIRDADVNDQCQRDMELYMTSANSAWAVQMFDSSAKLPVGLLKGNFAFFGNYYECIYTSGPNESFIGQHCMVDVNIELQPIKIPIFYGVCIPSSCNNTELEEMVHGLINNDKLQLSTVLSNATVLDGNCRTKHQPPLRAGDWAVVAFILFMVVVAFLSTLYDVNERFNKNNDKPHQLLSAFSVYTNGKELLKVDKREGQMSALYGIRTITMGWVVLGHSYLNTAYSPTINLADLMTIARDGAHIIIFNAFVAVDTFFMLSGMLVCFVFFRAMSSRKTYDVPMSYVHRYLRLTPSYAMIILLEVTILNYIGDGPFWKRQHDLSTEHCEKWWWTSLLYVQNYVNPLEICITQSWYLSSDMQMFWVAPLLLYPMYFWPKLAMPLLGVTLLSTTMMTFGLSYAYDLPPSLTEQSDARMIIDYNPMHTRLAPWIIGVALGYIICGIRANVIKVKLSPLWLAVGSLVAFVINVASMQGMMAFLNGHDNYSTLESASFIAFHRVGWALGIAWIIFLCVTGYGGLVNMILSFNLFQPMAKLTYGAYLIHYSVQRFRIGSLLTNVVMNDLDMTYYFIADFVVSMLLAIPLYLLFEQPFLHIDRFFLGGKTIYNFPKSKKKNNRKRKDSLKKEDGKQTSVEEGRKSDAFVEIDLKEPVTEL